MFNYSKLLSIFLIHCVSSNFAENFIDICGVDSYRRYYLEYGESGTLLADFQNNVAKNKWNITNQMRCSIEFITCPSCIVEIKFRFINISRSCGKSPVFDNCGCNYVLIYEPSYEDVSGEQFCGRYVQNNSTELSYRSLTRTVAIAFTFSTEYGYAFTLDYYVERNRINYKSYPTISNMNNATQYISSPFFPYLYPIDLSVEYVLHCDAPEICRISVVFTDFLLADSSMVEFFDWNGQRIYVSSGSAFRPPVIISSGPALVIRFYANGASDYGFKASYMFILGEIDDFAFKPSIGCGGHVNNLGGGIIMNNMVTEATKLFDCIWLIKPPESFLHRKTHLYVKVVNFSGFASSTELIVRQGLTSNQPPVDILKYPMSRFTFVKQKEHVVPISQGFYVSLKGMFRPESNVVIVYSTFNYKDCFAGSDFLCHNLRCIPSFLSCDGLDHCGDNSDESKNCSQDPLRDRREFSRIPNFLFPKIDPYSDLTAATLVFIMCSFGLIGVIFVMALLLYRVNVRARHQRHVQDHIATIHAILEEGTEGLVEEIIEPDEPPDYEPPPEYAEVLKLQKYIKEKLNKKCHCNSGRPCTKYMKSATINACVFNSSECSFASTSKSCQTTPIKIPESPPPVYEEIKSTKDNKQFKFELNEESIKTEAGQCIIVNEGCSTASTSFENSRRSNIKYFKELNVRTSRHTFSKFRNISLPKKCSSDENIYRHLSESIDAKIKNLCFCCNQKVELRKSYSSDNVFDF